MWACYYGNLEVVQTLINKCANLDKVDANGWTALQHAAYKDYHEVVDALIKAKADLDIGDKHGYTALHWASSLGFLKTT
jgi:ankyrin repeat protein